MTRYYLLSCVLLWLYFPSFAQCPPGDVTFEHQADVDAFVALYPDCDRISGDLRIGYRSNTNNINDLSGLNSIVLVEGFLSIRDNAMLSSLHGLEQLAFVNSFLSITSHPLLATLAGIENLISVNGNLSIRANANLTSIAALQNVAASSINNLSIAGNPLLSTCNYDNICTHLSNCANNAYISGNTSGCTSRLDIKTACTPPVEDAIAEPVGLPIEFSEGTIVNTNLSPDGNRLSIARILSLNERSLVVNVFEWDGASWIDQGQSSALVTSGFGEQFVTAFSADGRRLACNTTILYDFFFTFDAFLFEWTGGSQWEQIDESGAFASGTRFSLSADGSRVASIYWDGQAFDEGQVTVSEWNGTTWNQLGEPFMGDHLYALLDRAYLSYDGRRLALDVRRYGGPPSADGRLRLYEWSGTEWVRMPYDDPDMAQAVFHSFSGTGDHFIGSHDGKRKYYAWNGSSWTLADIIEDTTAGTEDWILSEDGQRLYTTLGGRLFHWDGTHWNESESTVFPYCDLALGSPSLSANAHRIAIRSSNNQVVVYTLAVPGFQYQLPTQCATAAARTFSGAVSPLGGSFTGPGVSTDTVAGSFSFDPSQAGIGTHVITYSVGDNVFTTSIDVAAPQAPSLSLSDTIWLTSPTLRYLTGSGLPQGGIYEDDQGILQDDGNGLTFSLDPLLSITSTTIHYSVYDENGCQATTSQTVTFINESPTAGGPHLNQLGEDIYNRLSSDGTFGYAVSLSADGDLLAIGDPTKDLGEVHLYRRTGDDWILDTTLVARYWDDRFGADVALSGDGNRLIIGAPDAYCYDFYGGYSEGVYRVYEWDGATWQILLDGICTFSGVGGIRSGSSVDISADGTLIVIGKAGDFGPVQTLRETETGWESSTIFLNGSWAGYFGNTVALSDDGNRLAVSENVTANNVRVYEWSGNDWLQIGSVINQPTWAGQREESLDISADGNRLVIGSSQYHLDGGFGQVEVYEWNGSDWQLMNEVIDGTVANEGFGASVVITADGNRLFVGAPSNGENGSNAGRSYSYEWDGNTWQLLTQNVLYGGDQAADQFGFDLATTPDGTLVAVGAIQEDLLNASGYVRLFAPFSPAFQNRFLPVCGAADPVTDLRGGYPVGGTYSGPGVTDNADGATFTFDPTVVAPGMAEITYTINNVTLTNTLEVLTPPTVSLTLPDTIFFDPTNLASISETGLPAGGTYRDSAGQIMDDSNGLSFTLSPTQPLTNTEITYTYYSAIGCAGTITQSVVLIDETAQFEPGGQLGEDINGILPEDQIGFAVSLSEHGRHLAVGAPFAGSTGQVMVYELSGTEWIARGTTIEGMENWEGFGYSLSLSANGERLLVGIPFLNQENNDGNVTQIGGFQLYEWDGSQYANLGDNYFFSAGENGDELGEAVDLSANGTLLAVGRPGSPNGRVDLFRDTGTGLEPLPAPNLVGNAVNSRFGEAVALSADGTRLVVGEPAYQMIDSPGGRVHVYEWNDSAWVPMSTPLVGGAAGDDFGRAVTINHAGTRIAIGAPQATLDDAAGYVTTYEWNGNNWLPLGGQIMGEYQGETFGAAVSLSPDGSRLLVGAPNNDITGERTGRAALYQWHNDTWQPIDDIIQGGDQANDQFGFSVACSSSGNVMAMGAVQTNSLEERGYVRAFSPNIPNFQNSLPAFCEDAATFDHLGGAFPAGGVYSGPGVTDNGDGNGFAFDPNAAGVREATINYQLDDLSLTNSIEVAALPSVTLHLPDTLFIEAGAPSNLPGTGLPAGGVYESASGLFMDAADGLNLTYNGAEDFVAEQQITYTYTSEQGCTSSSTKSVTVIDSNYSPPCDPPTALAISDLSQTLARVVWEQAEDHILSWELEIVAEEQALTGEPTHTNLLNPSFLWNEATQNTSYRVSVRSVCESGTTAWSEPLTFTTHPGCGDTFYDLGGAEGNYPGQQLNQWTFCPDGSDQVVRIDFSNLELGPSTTLNIYNGHAVTSPPILLDIVSPVSVTSSALNGCLTVEFTSTSDTTAAGWEAQIHCVPILTNTTDLPNNVNYLEAYPNPTSGHLQLQALFATPLEIEIEMVDLLGRVQWQEKHAKLQFLSKELDLNDFAASTYILRIRVDQQWITRRIVKM